MTEQQVPMFMRLVALIQALNQKQLRSNTDFQDNLSVSSENKGLLGLLNDLLQCSR